MFIKCAQHMCAENNAMFLTRHLVPEMTCIIPVTDRARPEAWPAAAIVRSRVCARTVCIVCGIVCGWPC